MNIHIAIYKWIPKATPQQIAQALQSVEALAGEIPGILDITTGENTSKYSDGYTHAIVVRGENQAAINAYRNHPGHTKAAMLIESIEAAGIGVDIAKEPMASNTP